MEIRHLSLEPGTASPEKSGTFLKNAGKDVGFPWSDGKLSDDRMSKEGAKDVELGETNSNAEALNLAQNTGSQETEDMQQMFSISEAKTMSLSQRGKEEKLSGAKGDYGLADTVERFFSLSDQSKNSDSDEEIPLTDSDLECSSSASIWASNNLTCRRKSLEQTSTGGNLGTKLRGDLPNDQDEVGEMQWDYTATQQAFLKVDSTNDI
ncbi:hypothetical protein NDU88_004417 [Pleurodeles waltl]|uniref:Uncharacterized protein n=1 Tax=Pleurodeles waltl TaxID=8319 RepID=A0AAV7M697_PLEWA|nr:hypothetical protein NDU88_004417 [Pleurodeles waltl]